MTFAGDAESSFYGIGDRRDNRITGLDGNDTFNGGVGVDTLVGGKGNDTYIVDEFDKIVELSGGGVDTIWSYDRSGSYSLPDFVENLVQKVTVRSGGTLSGNALNNQITGSSATDTIDGNGGSDTLIGGLGIDTFVVTAGEATVNDLGYGGNDNFTVEKGAKLTAIATSNWVGSSSVINEGEVKILSKGKLIDLSRLPQRNGFEVENLGGSAKLIGSAAEDTISGGKFSDTLQGSGGADTLKGGLGADTFLIDAGKDKITDLGLGGSDIIQVYLGAQVDAVLSTHWVGRGTVNYSDDGSARLFANGKSVNLSSVTTGNGFYIENLNDVGGSSAGLAAVTLWGSAAEDTIIGGPGNDTLYGGRGDDRIVGLGGNDRIDAGPGSDTVVLSAADSANDTLIGGDGVDTLEISNTFTFSANASGFESIALMVDKSGANPPKTTLTVSPEFLTANSISSIRGSTDSADTEELVVALKAGTVNLSKITSLVDAIVLVDSSTAVAGGNVTAVGTGFGDRFKSGATAVGVTVGGVFDGGAGADTMEGGSGADSFIGGAGADSLSGGDGADTLSGGAGVDTLLGGANNDVLILRNSEDDLGDYLDGGADSDTLRIEGIVNLWEAATTVKSFEAVSLTEGSKLTMDFRAFTSNHNYPNYNLNNISTISGATGGVKEIVTIVSDKYNGQAHDFPETIDLSAVVLDSDVVLAIEAYGGADTVRGSSSGANSIQGGEGSDSIFGGNMGDDLDGGTGNDSIIGNNGADTIYGGEGIDRLSGNADFANNRDATSDRFVYRSYGEAPIGQPTWVDSSGNSTKLDATKNEFVALSSTDVLTVDAIDFVAETIEGFEVLKDYLDLPDGTDPGLPAQIKAVENISLVQFAVNSLDIKPFQTAITATQPYYEVINGVLKVWTNTNRTTDASSNWLLHNWLAAVDSIADVRIPVGQAGVIVFEYKYDPPSTAADTYVFARGGTTPSDLLIRLAGVSGITAFSEQSNGLVTTLAGG